MHDVFTKPRFYEGCQGYLHLWLNCAMKTMNEAVVEGMGGVWDGAASDARHPSFEKGAEEAVVAWNAPWPYHADAEPFINRALTHLFGGSNWSKHFTHVNERVDQIPARDPSVGAERWQGGGPAPQGGQGAPARSHV